MTYMTSTGQCSICRTEGKVKHFSIYVTGSEGVNLCKSCELDNGKIKLQELFPNHKLMTIKECLDELGWEYSERGEHSFNEIKCCGEPVSIGGWVGPEHASCKKCDKGMQDVTGILPHSAMIERGAGVCQHIDYEKIEIPEDGRVWVPIKCW